MKIFDKKPWNTLTHICNKDQNWLFRLPKFKYLPLAEGLGSSEGGQKRGRQGPHDPQGPTSQSLGHATSHLNKHYTTIRLFGKTFNETSRKLFPHNISFVVSHGRLWFLKITIDEQQIKWHTVGTTLTLYLENIITNIAAKRCDEKMLQRFGQFLQKTAC